MKESCTQFSQKMLRDYVKFHVEYEIFLQTHSTNIFN